VCAGFKQPGTSEFGGSCLVLADSHTTTAEHAELAENYWVEISFSISFSATSAVSAVNVVAF
jgi:hypothetical protein